MWIEACELRLSKKKMKNLPNLPVTERKSWIKTQQLAYTQWVIIYGHMTLSNAFTQHTLCYFTWNNAQVTFFSFLSLYFNRKRTCLGVTGIWSPDLFLCVTGTLHFLMLWHQVPKDIPTFSIIQKPQNCPVSEYEIWINISKNPSRRFLSNRQSSCSLPQQQKSISHSPRLFTSWNSCNM